MANVDLPHHLAQNISEYKSVVASHEKKTRLAKSMLIPIGKGRITSDHTWPFGSK